MVTEDQVEEQCIGWFKDLGYQYENSDKIISERGNPETVILVERLRSALTSINPDIPTDTVDEAISQLLNPNAPGLLTCNRKVHQWLTKGIQVTFHKDLEEIGQQLIAIDYKNPENNDWLVTNQFAVHGKRNRRPDVVIFVNGIPLSVIELKNPAKQEADIWAAFNQLQTYKHDIPDLFYYNLCLVISDNIYARMGALSAERERFMLWRTIDGVELDPLGKHQQLETLVKGFFKKELLLNYLRHFCLFGDAPITKKIAAYHQFHAVQTAVESIVTASGGSGTKKGGVVWHTQGAGKSIEMAYLAGRLISEPRLENPTIVVVTDRQDLEGQLFHVFTNTSGLLGETPVRADSRAHLRELLMDRPSGGIVFTTIQKFGLESGENEFPALTDRHNVVVIADEAHRSHYGFKARMDGETGFIRYGLAKSLRNGLPNATFIAFTGTPISQDDRDTRAVFGEYISIYDIQQAVDDGATVPIYYESRLAKIKLNRPKLPHIDEEVEDILADETVDEQAKERAKRQWSALEAIIGTDARLEEIARDLIQHYETRSKTQPGKALIVAMSRDICVRLYNKITALRPEWHSPNLMEGTIKIVMTTSASDKQELQPHHTNREQKKDLEKRFKNPGDPLQLVIVRDMWLTGFDAPCLATMYIDKPMQGANIAQAIARVNRVFKDKPGGLVVDYIGIAPQLKEALAVYSAAKGKGAPTIDVSEALRILDEALHAAKNLLQPVNWSKYKTEALKLMPACLDRILEQENGKRKYCDVVLKMTKAFALCGTHDKALALAPEVAFHQAVRALLIKGGSREAPERDVDYELRQLLSEAVVGEGVTDVFKLAGLETPDISILSEEFLEEVRKMPYKNLAVELLQRLIRDEVKTRFHTNVVMQQKFSALLEQALNKYLNRTIETAQAIEELIALTKQFQKDSAKGKKHDLSPEEEAFYDALAQNDSVRAAMDEKVLIEMAKKIATQLRQNYVVDWAKRDNIMAKLRMIVRKLLMDYEYPQDEQEKTVILVIKQAKAMNAETSSSQD